MKEKTGQQQINSSLENETARAAFLRLVEDASRGDSEAISALCAEIAKDVLFRTTRILNNRSDAEDVAQETLLRVCKNIRQLKEPKAFRMWLSSIVLNEARRQMMQNAKQWNILYLSEELESAPEENEDFLPEAYTENEENRRAVIDAIDDLPLRQREAIVLHYYDRLSVTETADVMGIPQPSVSLYLRHARNKIKAKLESRASLEKWPARGFAFLPIGIALTRVLSAEGTAFTPPTAAWLPEVLAKCFESANIAAAEASTVFTGAESSLTANVVKDSATAAITAKSGLIAATSLIATAAVAISAVLWAPENKDIVQKEPTIAVGEVLFSGGNADFPHLNPENAEAVTDSVSGELTVLDWKITPVGSDDVIFSGEGDNKTVNGVFNEMRANGMEGEYMLTFLLEDSNRDTYRLGSSFIIHIETG
ncbi:MAG: sigma-70 family RNA polymerase sigma factor [Oscillospiraceae bacterium]|nr:sigma-70 family RNA polymerase sigma factor [Oscillospiraceae bacterium]